ncbi:hypothetical protein BDR03DRAFT_974929 [Suillus americanus]|nr:hypothetical protein BDR03DRAFT_974929 [Suillus americanus]
MYGACGVLATACHVMTSCSSDSASSSLLSLDCQRTLFNASPSSYLPSRERSSDARLFALFYLGYNITTMQKLGQGQCDLNKNRC